MSTQPKWQEPRHCKDCKHFGHWVAGKSHVWCEDGKIVHANPAHACVYWKKWAIYPANAEEPQKAEKAPDH